MACDIQMLLSQSACFHCLTANQVQLVRIALLCALSNGETMTCDISTLLASANCLQCLPADQLNLIELAVLCQLVEFGVGSGAVLIDRNPAAPDNPAKPAISIPSNGGAWTYWNPATGVWA